MEKFSNVDILAALDAIMRQNTGFYQDQFQNDRQTITEAAASPAKDDKTLLWVSAPAGTCCETEKNLLIRENVEYGRFRVFAEGVRLDGDKALCYAVKITGAEGGKITGDLYRLDYLEQLARLSDVALPAAYVTFTGKDGAAHRFPYKEYRENEQRIRRRFGPCRSFAYEPKSKVTLARRLRLEQEGREREARPADLQAHVRQLAADKVQDEAQRIACEFARLWNPNGGDGRFMVKISEIFLNIATKDEVNQLAAALPYKSLTFATRRDGCPGLFAFVGKEENRGEIARRMILGERPEPEARKKPPHKAGPERS